MTNLTSFRGLSCLRSSLGKHFALQVLDDLVELHEIFLLHVMLEEMFAFFILKNELLDFSSSSDKLEKVSGECPISGRHSG